LKQRLKQLVNALVAQYRTLFHFDGDNKSVIVEEWEKLPTFDEYIAIHPECLMTNQESVKCCFCGGEKTYQHPLTGIRDRREKHFCTGCKRALYRSYADF